MSQHCKKSNTNLLAWITFIQHWMKCSAHKYGKQYQTKGLKAKILGLAHFTLSTVIEWVTKNVNEKNHIFGLYLKFRKNQFQNMSQTVYYHWQKLSFGVQIWFFGQDL